MNSSFCLNAPNVWSSCAVFSSPHSGSRYPRAFLDSGKLDAKAIRSSEDAYVDDLFASAPENGAPLLSARLPRAYVDLNRARDELDPALIEGIQRSVTNPRIAAGLGVIPRVVSEGRVIRDGKITSKEAMERLREVYDPYHNQLRALLKTQRDRHGMAILYDCHSMPHDALCSAPMVKGKRPDIVLGDRFGSSCMRWLMDAAQDIFAAQGFVVARNAPFAGGYITQFYGRPSQNIHAVQIEIDRALYMDELTLEKSGAFAEMEAALRKVVGQLAQQGGTALSLAAE